MEKELRRVMDVFEEDIDSDECILFYKEVIVSLLHKAVPDIILAGEREQLMINVFNYYRKKFLPEYYHPKEKN